MDDGTIAPPAQIENPFEQNRGYEKDICQTTKNEKWTWGHRTETQAPARMRGRAIATGVPSE